MLIVPIVEYGFPVETLSTVTIDSVSTGKPYSTMGTINIGQLIYIDRSYRISTFPGAPSNWTLIRTAEDDKAVTADTHLKFTVTGQSFVWLLYDTRAVTLPTWAQTQFGTTPVVTMNFAGQNVRLGFFGPLSLPT